MMRRTWRPVNRFATGEQRGDGAIDGAVAQSPRGPGGGSPSLYFARSATPAGGAEPASPRYGPRPADPEPPVVREPGAGTRRGRRREMTDPRPAVDPAIPIRDRVQRVRRGLFFIVGCGRSGTTLLRFALTNHPAVSVPEETKFYARFPGRVRYGGDPQRPSDWDGAVEAVWQDAAARTGPPVRERLRAYADVVPRTWDGLFTALMTAYADVGNASRVGEKSPVHTRFIGRLSEAFPEARFVHLVRDPRAVVLSRMKAGFGSRRIGRHVLRWREAVAAHRRHAAALGPDRYLVVRYEDLVSDLRTQIEAVCRLLDLELVPAMLEPHRREGAGFRPDAEWLRNTLRPVFTDSIDRWRTELPPRQVALIESALADEMREMGYATSGGRTPLAGPRVAASAALGELEARRRRLARAGLRTAGLLPARDLAGDPPDASDSEDPDDIAALEGGGDRSDESAAGDGAPPRTGRGGSGG